MRSITLILTLALLIGLAVWVFLRPSPPSKTDAAAPGKTAAPSSRFPARAQTRPMDLDQRPRPVIAPRDEPPAPVGGNNSGRARPVYPQEALPFIKPEPVLEPPEPTQTHAVPQSMIDEQNRQNEFQPQPLPADARP